MFSNDKFLKRALSGGTTRGSSAAMYHIPNRQDDLTRSSGDPNVNLTPADTQLLPVDEVESHRYSADAGYRVAIGNNRNNQGEIPKELALTRLLRVNAGV